MSSIEMFLNLFLIFSLPAALGVLIGWLFCNKFHPDKRERK